MAEGACYRVRRFDPRNRLGRNEAVTFLSEVEESVRAKRGGRGYLMVAHSDGARARFLTAFDESLAALSLTISRDGLTSLTNPNAPRRGFARLA